MINVWDYANAKKVKITNIDKDVFIGRVVCVMDTEENGENEDDITIQVDKNTIIGFFPSEIKNIEVIE